MNRCPRPHCGGTITSELLLEPNETRLYCNLCGRDPEAVPEATLFLEERRGKRYKRGIATTPTDTQKRGLHGVMTTPHDPVKFGKEWMGR